MSAACCNPNYIHYLDVPQVFGDVWMNGYGTRSMGAYDFGGEIISALVFFTGCPNHQQSPGSGDEENKNSSQSKNIAVALLKT